MRYCISNGCTSLVEEGTYYCNDHKPRKRKRDGFQSANKSFYKTDEWKDMRHMSINVIKACVSVAANSYLVEMLTSITSSRFQNVQT